MRSYLRDNPCVDCGCSDIRVLEFDHLDPETKNGTVSRMMLDGAAIYRLRREVAKCEVRCANCHRIKTTEQGQHFRACGNSEGTDPAAS